MTSPEQKSGNDHGTFVYPSRIWGQSIMMRIESGGWWVYLGMPSILGTKRPRADLLTKVNLTAVRLSDGPITAKVVPKLAFHADQFH